MRIEAIIGTKVKLIIRENIVAKVTVKPNCRKNCPVMPDIKAIGVNTTTLVKVEAATAIAISEAPLEAASLIGFPRDL